jgi:hypothetical protein
VVRIAAQSTKPPLAIFTRSAQRQEAEPPADALIERETPEILTAEASDDSERHADTSAAGVAWLRENQVRPTGPPAQTARRRAQPTKRMELRIKRHLRALVVQRALAPVSGGALVRPS